MIQYPVKKVEIHVACLNICTEIQYRMSWFHRKVAACALLIAYVILSSSVFTEARISKFEAIQGASLFKFGFPPRSYCFTPIDW